MSNCRASTPLIERVMPCRLAGSQVPKVVIEREPRWRCASRVSRGPDEAAKIGISRWRSVADCRREVVAETPSDSHLVAIVLANENIHFSISGRDVHDGPAGPGMVHVTPPSTMARGLFRGSFDVLHLHVPNTLIAHCRSDRPGDSGAYLEATRTLKRDCRIEALGRALMETDRIGGQVGELYADSISTAIVVGLLADGFREGAADGRKVSRLSKWRLKRVIEYIDANLAEALSLPAIARVAGLTRMHFAAQFRAATGFRPHEYVLRRRIDRAQRLLQNGDMKVVDVALSVGFQNQSHFTNVFKQFAGLPPAKWRQAFHDEACTDEPPSQTPHEHRNLLASVVERHADHAFA